MQGYIHSFESFGTLDGPGIRFVIFMQGCPLRCAYCHNPDTWNREGTPYETKEIVNQVLKYKNYIKKSGGVTISGGEPLLQMDFVIELCKSLKQEGFHVAIDTSGYINNRIEELIDYVDLFLLDIKEIDNKKHEWLTTKSNQNCLNLATYLSDHNKEMWIRYVLVPTVTDSMEDIIGLRDFIKTLKTVSKIEVLPYHTLGVSKYEKMGIPYRLEGINPPDEELIKKVRSILND